MNSRRLIRTNDFWLILMWACRQQLVRVHSGLDTLAAILSRDDNKIDLRPFVRISACNRVVGHLATSSYQKTGVGTSEMSLDSSAGSHHRPFMLQDLFRRDHFFLKTWFFLVFLMIFSVFQKTLTKNDKQSKKNRVFFRGREQRPSLCATNHGSQLAKRASTSLCSAFVRELTASRAHGFYDPRPPKTFKKIAIKSKYRKPALSGRLSFCAQALMIPYCMPFPATAAVHACSFPSISTLDPSAHLFRSEWHSKRMLTS
jgi:hypothetical protein